MNDDELHAGIARIEADVRAMRAENQAQHQALSTKMDAITERCHQTEMLLGEHLILPAHGGSAAKLAELDTMIWAHHARIADHHRWWKFLAWIVGSVWLLILAVVGSLGGLKWPGTP
jgi:hypothetical protein